MSRGGLFRPRQLPGAGFQLATSYQDNAGPIPPSDPNTLPTEAVYSMYISDIYVSSTKRLGGKIQLLKSLSSSLVDAHEVKKDGDKQHNQPHSPNLFLAASTAANPCQLQIALRHRASYDNPKS